MTKVSIILPVYNGQKYIGNTIDMLCNTMLNDIEIIVVDDGSQDDSYRIACMCADRDKRVKVYQKKNEGGVYAARNFGMKKAIGEYVCFCDQDDVVESDIYEKMYKCTQNGKSDVVICSVGKLMGESKEDYEILADSIIDNREQIRNLLLGNVFRDTKVFPDTEFYLGNTIWKCMVRREFITENDLTFRRYVNYEDDYLFLLDILARAKVVVTMSDVLYYWRVNLKSETFVSKYVEDMRTKAIELQSEIENVLRLVGVNGELLEKFHQHYNCVRYINILENEEKNNEEYLLRKINRVKEIQAESDYRISLKMRKFYKKNMIRKIVALWLMEKGQVCAAYLFLCFFNKVKLYFIQDVHWNRLEKRMSKM